MASKPKPPVSVWVIAQRKDHRESVEDVARVVDRSPATIRGWEAGRPPAADDPTIAVLERHWGSVAPLETVGQSDLVAALRDQTAALTLLVDRVDLLLAAHQTASTDLMRAIGVAVGDPARPGTPDGAGRATPAGTHR